MQGVANLPHLIVVVGQPRAAQGLSMRVTIIPVVLLGRGLGSTEIRDATEPPRSHPCTSGLGPVVRACQPSESSRYEDIGQALPHLREAFQRLRKVSQKGEKLDIFGQGELSVYLGSQFNRIYSCLRSNPTLPSDAETTERIIQEQLAMPSSPRRYSSVSIVRFLPLLHILVQDVTDAVGQLNKGTVDRVAAKSALPSASIRVSKHV